MKLLFLHGAPAAGKLTVAKALLEKVPGRLFDNHAAIDFARTLFEFGAPGFWELVHSTRYRRSTPPANTAWRLWSRPSVMSSRTICRNSKSSRRSARRHGGELLPVFLHCSREEAVRRVGNPDRVERRKIASASYLIKELDNYEFTAVPRRGCLTLDTGAMPAEFGRAGNHWPFRAKRGLNLTARVCLGHPRSDFA